mmetsp:Transcript_25187/g.65073  ORF Transcript_25187/g.65073 Transcript_25187/m.65073 type:complete len:329 (+) Transcript_25187:113-1099(+)
MVNVTVAGQRSLASEHHRFRLPLDVTGPYELPSSIQPPCVVVATLMGVSIGWCLLVDMPAASEGYKELHRVLSKVSMGLEHPEFISACTVLIEQFPEACRNFHRATALHEWARVFTMSQTADEERLRELPEDFAAEFRGTQRYCVLACQKGGGPSSTFWMEPRIGERLFISNPVGTVDGNQKCCVAKRTGICPTCTRDRCTRLCAHRGRRMLWCKKCFIEPFCSTSCWDASREHHRLQCSTIRQALLEIGLGCVCATCGVPQHSAHARLRACSGCNVALYCSADCQRAGWNGGHRMECKLLRRDEPDDATSSAADHGPEVAAPAPAAS